MAADFSDLAKWRGHSSALPPISPIFKIGDERLAPNESVLENQSTDPEPISAFVCVIEYEGVSRLITCRRYDLLRGTRYVGAICHSARGYRQFRCDRIGGVFDASTGEHLGDGTYFTRFRSDSEKEHVSPWGLAPRRKAILVAGLNVLAFMARCDGQWHPLEADVIERFICSMWLKKEWAGDPPIDEIVAHAQRLSPDSDLFFHSLRIYASNAASTRILCAAVSDLIAADGVICAQEVKWGAEIDAFFDGYREEEFRKLLVNGAIVFRVNLTEEI